MLKDQSIKIVEAKFAKNFKACFCNYKNISDRNDLTYLDK